MLIIYVIEVIVNTFRQNIRQVKQIKNSHSSFKNKVKHQDLEVNILDFLLELNYSFFYKF